MDARAEVLGWGVVANADDRVVGADLEIHRGLKHFAPGAKVRVSDPPPLEVVRDGTTLYLAHFNYRKARYSALPPPVEPVSPRTLRWSSTAGRDHIRSERA